MAPCKWTPGKLLGPIADPGSVPRCRNLAPALRCFVSASGGRPLPRSLPLRRLRRAGSDPGRHGDCRGRSRCRRGYRKYRWALGSSPGSCARKFSMQVSSELHEPVVCFAWFVSFAYSGWVQSSSHVQSVVGVMVKRKGCKGCRLGTQLAGCLGLNNYSVQPHWSHRVLPV